MSTPITLTYGTTTITLGVPLFGNTDSIEQTRINRETRAGDLIIFRNSQWPVIEIQDFKFENLTQQKIKDYLDFIELSLGKEVTMVDHNGDSWTGIITNPEAVGEQVGSGCGGFNTELKFEGTLD